MMDLSMQKWKNLLVLQGTSSFSVHFLDRLDFYYKIDQSISESCAFTR